MKFALVLSLAASAMALNAGTPTKRDAASISSAISVVSASVAALDTSIKSFSGAGDVAAIQTGSDNAVSAIDAATSAADASAPLASLEAIALVTPIQDLSALVNTTVSDLIAKKSALDSAGASPAVLSALQKQLTSSQALSAAIISKLPTDLQATGQGLSQPIIDSLNQGITAFSGSSSSSSASASASTSASASASESASASATSAIASASATATGSEPASHSGTASSWAHTTEAATATSTHAASTTSAAPVSTFTGAAAPAAAGYGVAALAAVAAAVAVL